jgi:hypothetical protein
MMKKPKKGMEDDDGFMSVVRKWIKVNFIRLNVQPFSF